MLWVFATVALASPDWRLDGRADDQWLGQTVLVADVTGDGYDDVLVSRRQFWGGTLALQLYPGGPNGPALAPTWTSARLEGHGDLRAAVGDFDGDGHADLAVAEYQHAANSGRIEVYYGTGAGPSAVAGWSHDGAFDEGVGFSLAAVDGDLDGFDDLWFTNSAFATPDQIWTVPGGTTGLGAPTVWLSDGSLYRLVSVGDVDGDGAADLGAWTFSGLTHTSTIWRSDVAGPQVWWSHASPDASTVLRGAADIDGDGLRDVLTSGMTGAGTPAVTAYVSVFRNGPAGPSTVAADWTWSTAGGFLQTVAAGDVDGDGDDDVVFAVAEAISGPGYLWTFYGDPALPAATPDVEVAFDKARGIGSGGLALGDVTGDGLADIAVGRSVVNLGPDERAGQVLVFYGP